jgi:hypothetical protein
MSNVQIRPPASLQEGRASLNTSPTPQPPQPHHGDKLEIVIRHKPDRPIIVVSIVSYSALGDATGEMSYVQIRPLCLPCELVTISQPLLILLGGLAILGSFMLEGGLQVMSFMTGLVLIVMYFYTRNSVLSITSSGGSKIVVPAKGMARAKIIEFIDAVEKAKVSFIAKA